MTPEEFIKKLEELKAASERAIISRLPTLEKFAYGLMSDMIDQSLDTQNGRIVPNEAAERFLNTFADEFLNDFTKAKTYRGAISGYLKNFKDIGQIMREFHKSQKLDIKPAQISSVQEIVVNEIINRYSENGLNPGFVQPLRQVLFQNITAGTNKGQAMQQLQTFIAGGKDTTGKLHRYLEQTAQQGVDNYEGAINTRVMTQFDINTLIMSGSLIKTSSPQCRWAINELEGIIDREDFPELKQRAQGNGWVEGATFDNLPILKNHFGCRHSFTPAVLTAEQRKQLTSNPTNN
jgi:hypothetical protein